MKEFLFFAVFTFIMTIGVGVNASASEIENPDNIQEAEVETFDLTGNIAQEKEIVLEDGTEGTLGIMPIIDERPLLKGTYSLANGTS
ncbi:TPA: hypothetical protein IP926_001254, partial [Listeria monocytogenes]|nr:hypothetical protein [Listeria monocytogenes]